MGCDGCGKARAAPKPKKTAEDYLDGPATATVAPPATDPLIAKMRLAMCERCEEKVLDADGGPTDQRLQGHWEGKLHCGNPNDPDTATDSRRFGWGGAVEERAVVDAEVCPRKHWGPGRSFFHTEIPMLPTDRAETLPGVIDFIGPTRTAEGVNDMSGIGDIMVQGVVAQAIKRFNAERGLRVRFLTVEGQVNWAKMSCPGIEVLAVNDMARLPPGEFGRHSAPLRAVEVDATCRMQGQNRHEFLAHQFGVPVEETETWEMPLTEEAYAVADEFLSVPRKAGRPVVCVAPYAHSPTRQWPVRYWVELISILEKLKLAVFTLYKPPREGEHDQLRKLPIRAFKSTDPQEVAAVVARSDMVIGNDSGVCHIAGILRKPALSICGPTDGNIVFGGWPTVRHIQAPGACAGCLWYQDGGWKPWCSYGCGILADLKPAAVLPRIKKILQEEGVI